MPSVDEPKFIKIKAEMDKNPAAVIADLCRKYKVKYRNYYNWTKAKSVGLRVVGKSGAKKSPPTVKPVKPVFPHQRDKNAVTIDVPLSEVVDMVKNQRPTLVVPRERVLSCLSPEELNEVDRIIGRMTRERLAEAKSNGHSLPKTVFGPITGGGEENGS